MRASQGSPFDILRQAQDHPYKLRVRFALYSPATNFAMMAMIAICITPWAATDSR